MNIQHSCEELSEQTIIAWLSLARDSRFSVLQKHQLLKSFSSPIDIYQTRYGDLCALLGIKANNNKNTKFKACLGKGLEQDLLWVQHPSNHLVCWGAPQYPNLLAQITDPPICFFARGDLGLLMEPKVSLVGSRRPTPVGVKITQTIAAQMAHLGIVVTSGMALGIDAVSHQAALSIGEPTVAVMGCGLDIVSPARHRGLFEKIAESGLLLSEYPIAYPASKYTFPQRNRIVSGLSYGVVIVEAAEKSGTLITARLAMEQNREVFVVPGSSINPQYAGSHRLIKQGATLITGVDDILSELSGALQLEVAKSAEDSSTKLSESKKSNQKLEKFPLLTHINYHPSTINQIILSSGLTASEVSSMLLILEIEGLVAVTPEGSYIRVS
ncbi:UNVERIFIED_CONTAM: hypothetical protein GTU68_003424 [Idotea baltica]|nr:hypothetical protein [Idotea baltica]